MSLFGLRRRQTTFDAPAAISPLDTATTSKPTGHLREVVARSQVKAYCDRLTARAAALELACAWGRSKRRDSAILRVAEQPGAGDLPLNDLAALHATVDANTAAIVIDLACLTLDPAYCQGAAQLCRALQILLMLDDSRANAPAGGPLIAERTWGIHADLVVLGPTVHIRTHTDGLAAALA